ncbi:hypothetical protein ACI78V_00125 [Geodermatophilus sp. SYSU D00742]
MTAFGASVATSWWLFPLYSANRDDSVYVAMARLLERVSVTLPADHDLLRPWASAVHGDRVVLKYTPPWPAVLAAADLLTGSPRTGLGSTAAGTAVLTAVLAGDVLRDRAAGLVAGALLTASPVFLVLSGTYLPYLFQLLLGLAFAVLWLRGVSRRSSVRVVAAGAVLGVAAFARPFDAVLFSLPFVLVVLAGAWTARRAGDRGGWSWVGCAARLAAGAVPLVVGSLVYNVAVMGHPFRLPYTATGPQDGFGFGSRGVFPESTIPFSPGDAWAGLLTNVRWLPSWTAGGVLLLVLAVVGLARTAGRARWAVAALALTVPLGYLPFWGPYAMSRLWDGVEAFGPFYHLPVVVPLCVFGAAGLVLLWRRASARARPLAASVVAAMVVLTVTAVPDKVAANTAVRDDFRAVERFVAGHDLADAILFLPRRGDLGFLSTTPFLENVPSLQQPVLYAEDRGPEVFGLVDRHPDRALYRLSEDLPSGRTTGGRLGMERLRVSTGSAVTVRLRLENPTDREVVVAYLSDGRSVWSRTLDRDSARGRTYDVSWTVTAPGTAPPLGGDAVRLSAGAPSGVMTAGIDVRVAGEEDRPGRRWERRAAYRLDDGSGRVELLHPGRGWSQDGPGEDWREAGVGNPVTDLAAG